MLMLPSGYGEISFVLRGLASDVPCWTVSRRRAPESSGGGGKGEQPGDAVGGVLDSAVDGVEVEVGDAEAGDGGGDGSGDGGVDELGGAEAVGVGDAFAVGSGPAAVADHLQVISAVPVARPVGPARCSWR